MKIYKTPLLIVAVIVLLLTNQVFIFAQGAPGPDGTFCTGSFYTLLNENFDEEANYPFMLGMSDANAQLTVNVHVIKDSIGNIGVSQSAIDEALEVVNETFGKIGISFSLGEFNIIPEYEYCDSIDSLLQVELFDKYLIDSTINLFLLDSVYRYGTNFYGLSLLPDSADAIFMRKDYIPGNAVITQLGHFFGLLSTHEMITGFELVNGSNCESAGDLICDTWADLGPYGVYGQVNEDCEYTGGEQDTNGEWYAPSVANYMADAPAECKCVFTKLQYRRIFYYYKKYRNYLR